MASGRSWSGSNRAEGRGLSPFRSARLEFEWERDVDICRPRRRHAALGAGLAPVPSHTALPRHSSPPSGQGRSEGWWVRPAAPSCFLGTLLAVAPTPVVP